jgi:hypothetical protein
MVGLLERSLEGGADQLGAPTCGKKSYLIVKGIGSVLLAG